MNEFMLIITRRSIFTKKLKRTQSLDLRSWRRVLTIELKFIFLALERNCVAAWSKRSEIVKKIDFIWYQLFCLILISTLLLFFVFFIYLLVGIRQYLSHFLFDDIIFFWTHFDASFLSYNFLRRCLLTHFFY